MNAWGRGAPAGLPRGPPPAPPPRYCGLNPGRNWGGACIFSKIEFLSFWQSTVIFEDEQLKSLKDSYSASK